MSEISSFDSAIVNDFFKNIKTKLSQVKNGQKKYLGLLSAIVFKDVIEHFSKQEGSDGSWKTWSPTYKAAMERRGKGGNKILVDTGRLRNTFKPTNMKNSEGGFLWYNNAQVNGFPYAAAHDEGDGKLPKRDFMWLSNNAMDDISEQTLQFMLEEGI